MGRKSRRILLAERRCTISRLSLKYCWGGSQTEDEYSRTGRTSVLKHFVWTEWGQPRRFRWMNADVLLALDEILEMCLFHERSFDNSTPRYLAFWTCCSCSPCRKYWAGIGFFFLVTVKTWHFPALKSICQVFSQDSNFSRSFCRCWQSKLFLMVRYKMVSSAKRRTLELMLLPISFMYARKSVGPRTDPCGTPEVTWPTEDISPSTTTCWVRSVRKFSIHLRVLPLMPR